MSSAQSMRGQAPRPRAQAGFTMVEMLAAVAVLVLLSSIIMMGVNALTQVYEREQFESQSQVLGGTLEVALSDPLRFAKLETDNADPAAQSWAVPWRGAYIKGPVADLLKIEDGKLLFSDGVSVVNAGAYGGLRVASAQASSHGSYLSVALTLTNAGGTLTKDFEYVFRPLSLDGSTREGLGVGTRGDNAGGGEERYVPDPSLLPADMRTLEQGEWSLTAMLVPKQGGIWHRVNLGGVEFAIAGFPDWDNNHWTEWTHHQVSLVLYDGVYYKSYKIENGEATDEVAYLDESFSPSDLTDGAPHNYSNWGDRYWVAVGTQNIG